MAASESGGGLLENADASFLTQGYEELVNAIIRPPRMEYSQSDMGPDAFQLCGKRFQRKDLELTNSRGHKLVCSWWKFTPEDAPAAQLPCVIYLHGNASCRLAAQELLWHLLPASISVFALDFSGSGISGGEHVSLGYFEREDVEAVIAHLRASGEVSTVGLWGHSMGASTALLYGDRDPSIAGMVVDSAFSDLMDLINELGQGLREQGLRVPGFAISMAIGLIRRSVRRRANFEPQEVSPIKKCGQCFIPALFAHGDKDGFIKPSHSEQLHAAYAGDKNLVLFDGDHNTTRPDFLFDSAVIFFRQTLGVKDEHCLDRSTPTHGPSLDRRAFTNGASAVRHTEEEMMRQAMMLSIADAQQKRQSSSSSPEGGGTSTSSPGPPAPTPSVEELARGAAAFHDVTGVAGDTARYYVEGALSRGGTVDDAIQQYFDGDGEGPPAGWH